MDKSIGIASALNQLQTNIYFGHEQIEIDQSIIKIYFLFFIFQKCEIIRFYENIVEIQFNESFKKLL